MDLVLLILYAAVLAAQLTALVWSARKSSGKKWLFLFLGEAASIAAAWCLMRWYDSLPGYGMMPGLTYFAETFYSMCAVVAYAAMLFVTFLVFMIVGPGTSGRNP